MKFKSQGKAPEMFIQINTGEENKNQALFQVKLINLYQIVFT